MFAYARNNPTYLTIAILSGILVTFGFNSVQAESQIDGYNIYYGHLHNHCSISDGSGTPDDAYSTAKLAGLDFFGLSDHAYALTDTEYEAMKTAANAYADGTFTTFWGFEWTSDTYGDVTVTNRDDYTAANNADTDTFGEFLSWLDSGGGVAFFNHPTRGFPNAFEHFTGAYSSQIVGMELWNGTDSSFNHYYDSGFEPDTTDYSGCFDEALFYGWQIGAAGSEDMHGLDWGSSSNRLAILAGSNTRSSLYSALQSRSFYSTLDKNLAMSFRVDGNTMGSSIAGGTNMCRIEVADGDAESFTKIELIHNGNVVRTWYSSDFADATHPIVSDSFTTAMGDTIYCKVTQDDGDEAISSPVFVVVGGPPQADLIKPQDGGGVDLNPNPDEVTVNTFQAMFQIQLSDTDGIDDFSVTYETLSITGLTTDVDYFFSYDADLDVITLLPPDNGDFENGAYEIVLSGSTSRISDSLGNFMDPITLTVLIDTSNVPPGTLSFQQGVNSYTDAVDIMIHGAYADTSFSTDTIITVDADDAGSESQVLLRFENIIGDSLDQIPPFANISSATLRLRTLDTGNGGQLYAMLQTWPDTSTWNSLAEGIQTDNVEALSVSDDSIIADSIGDVNLDVTATVQAWADSSLSNDGWAILPNSGGDGWDIASAEHGTADYRPELIVTFTATENRPPVADAGPDQNIKAAGPDDIVSVTLAGSATDVDGVIMSYEWLEEMTSLGTGQILIANFAVGTHTVILKVTDNEGATDTDAVLITIAENRAPIAIDDTYETNKNEELVLAAPGVLLNDSDPDGDPLTAVKTSDPFSGSVTLNEDGSLTYTPNQDFSGADSFTYQVNDGVMNSETATVAISVFSDLIIEDRATDEILVEGTTVNDYQATWSADGNVEVITETISGNNKNIRRSSLEHIWQFNVLGGDAVSLHLEATAQIEAGSPDQFVIAYSTDNVVYTDILTVAGTVAGDYPLPANLSGLLYIRVLDTNNDKLDPTTDSISVDYMSIRSTTTGTPDGDPPLPPTGLASTSQDWTIQLSWSANNEQDLAGYRVYRSVTSGSDYSEISNGLVLETGFTDVVPGAGLYYYMIKAEDFSGNLSGNSNETSITVIDAPPAAPAGLTASSGDTLITLDWDDNVESDLAGYRVYRDAVLVSGIIVSSEFTDTGLANGTQYTYTVTAVDLSGQESTANPSVTATPQIPQQLIVYVNSITAVVIPDKKKYSAQATVIIEPALGSAQITGDWYFKGTLRQSSAAGATDATGAAVISTSFSTPAKSGDEFIFMVTNVILNGYTYDASANVDTQGSALVP